MRGTYPRFPEKARRGPSYYLIICANIHITAWIGPELRSRAEAILAKLGLSPSDAIRLFYAQVTLRDGLPFEVRIPNATPRKALRDADAGKNLARYGSVDEMFRDLGV
jgi:DNA-damage-inducible protein J